MMDFIVDEKIKLFISKFNWNKQVNRCGTIYYYTSLHGKKIYLHRMVYGLFGGFQVDHKNKNNNDNTLDNLRPCDNHQNASNAVRKRKVSPYRGIYKRKNTWCAEISSLGKVYRKYGFKTPELAAIAYDKMAIEFHGDFATLNFPKQEALV